MISRADFVGLYPGSAHTPVQSFSFDAIVLPAPVISSGKKI